MRNLKGNIFGCTSCPSRFVAISFFLSFFINNISTEMPSSVYSSNALVAKRWEPNHPPPPVPEDQKKPGLNRINGLFGGSMASGLARWKSTRRTRVQIPLWPLTPRSTPRSCFLRPVMFKKDISFCLYLWATICKLLGHQ